MPSFSEQLTSLLTFQSKRRNFSDKHQPTLNSPPQFFSIANYPHCLGPPQGPLIEPSKSSRPSRPRQFFLLLLSLSLFVFLLRLLLSSFFSDVVIVVVDHPDGLDRVPVSVSE